MNSGTQGQSIQSSTVVTTVIRQQPKPGSVDRYEAWLKEIIPQAQSFAGHQSVSVIRPLAPGGAYTIVLHFDTVAHLRSWLDSDTRNKLIDRIRPDLRTPENIDIKTGFEFWFTPPASGRSAKPYKQFLVTLSAIFPLTVVVPWVLSPALERIPMLALPGIRHLVVASIIVALMVYVIMPRLTRALSRWLFE